MECEERNNWNYQCKVAGVPRESFNRCEIFHQRKIKVADVFARSAERETEASYCPQNTDETHRKEVSKPPVANQQAMLAMMAQLNLPWAQLLRMFDSITSKQVALLEFMPDSSTRTIKIFAEARNSAQMTRYLETLKKQENLVNVRLIQHEINVADKLNPIRFEFEVQWVTGGAP